MGEERKGDGEGRGGGKKGKRRGWERRGEGREGGGEERIGAEYVEAGKEQGMQKLHTNLVGSDGTSHDHRSNHIPSQATALAINELPQQQPKAIHFHSNCLATVSRHEDTSWSLPHSLTRSLT